MVGLDKRPAISGLGDSEVVGVLDLEIAGVGDDLEKLGQLL
jgi:hypothetical protein